MSEPRRIFVLSPSLEQIVGDFHQIIRLCVECKIGRPTLAGEYFECIEVSAYDQLKAERDELEAKAIALTMGAQKIFEESTDLQFWQAMDDLRQAIETHGVKK